MTDRHYVVYDAPVRQAFLAPAIDAMLRERSERIERELRDIGECLWTARDTVVIVHDGLSVRVSNP